MDCFANNEADFLNLDKISWFFGRLELEMQG